eukprot:4546057-Amphidinium_carterae.1
MEVHCAEIAEVLSTRAYTLANACLAAVAHSIQVPSMCSQSPRIEQSLISSCLHNERRPRIVCSCGNNEVSVCAQERAIAILAEWEETHHRILSSPENEEELAKLKEFMAGTSTNSLQVTRAPEDPAMKSGL